MKSISWGALALCAITVPAQTPWEEFTAPDGSRFLLVATGGPDSIHWTLATPCSAMEDPVGFEGLARAALYSSVTGTPTIGSLDPEREPEVLEALDALEDAMAKDLLAGNAVAPERIQRLEQLSDEVKRLADPQAWRRLLYSAPAAGLAVEVRNGIGLLSFRTVRAGISKAGELLRERREKAILRGVRDRFWSIRQADWQQWQGDTSGPLRAEATSLACLGHPLQRLATGPGPARKVMRSQAIAVWQRTQHPSRSLHVLVGGFAASEVRKELEILFARTNLPTPAPAEPGILPVPGAARRSTLPGPTSAVAVALRLPPGIDRSTAAAASAWLGDGAESYLAGAMIDAGFRSIEVSARFPFPPDLLPRGSQGLLLITVLVPEGTPRAEDPERLETALREALAAARTQLPRAKALRTIHRRAAPALPWQLPPSALARRLAAGCLYGQRTAAEVLARKAAPEPKACRAFLERLLAEENLIIAVWRPES